MVRLPAGRRSRAEPDVETVRDLLARAAPAEASFGAVLDTYFGGEPDPATDRILGTAA